MFTTRDSLKKTQNLSVERLENLNSMMLDVTAVRNNMHEPEQLSERVLNTTNKNSITNRKDTNYSNKQFVWRDQMDQNVLSEIPTERKKIPMPQEPINSTQDSTSDSELSSQCERLVNSASQTDEIKQLERVPIYYEDLNHSGHHRKQHENLMWSDNIEHKFKEWYLKCVSNSILHNNKAKYYQKMHYCISIPAAIIPFIAAMLGTTISNNELITRLTFTVLGILGVLQTSFGPEGKCKRHNEYVSKYEELSEEISTELCRPSENRPKADVFLQKIMGRYNRYNEMAPTS